MCKLIVGEFNSGIFKHHDILLSTFPFIRLERKLVRYVMEKLASMENPDVHGTDKPVNVNDNYVVDELQNLESAEKSNTSLPLVNKPGVAYSGIFFWKKQNKCLEHKKI